MSVLQPVSFKKGREHLPRLSPVRVPGRHSKRFWTDAERAIVKKYYPTGGVASCLAHLPSHRTPAGVYRTAWDLGLSCGSGQAGRIKPGAGFDEALKLFYQQGDGKKRGECNAFADKWKLPRWWVTKRAITLGLVIPHKKEPPWSAAELALLKTVPLHDTDKCSRIFHDNGFPRSSMAIRVRSTRMHLSRKYKETLSATAISKILGVDSKTVTRDIFEGRLKATKRKTARLPQQGGDHWSVTPADLRRYLLDNLHYVDLRKVEKFAFVQIIAAEPLEAEKP